MSDIKIDVGKVIEALNRSMIKIKVELSESYLRDKNVKDFDEDWMFDDLSEFVSNCNIRFELQRLIDELIFMKSKEWIKELNDKAEG